MNSICGEDNNKYYLMPGKMYCSDSSVLVHTVLGSCVAVTMYCKRIKLGAICHALLPEISQGNGCESVYRYVDSSITGMINIFYNMGVKKKEIEIKCFGGGDMFDSTSLTSLSNTVGKQNIIALNGILKQLGLNVISKDMGSDYGRKLYFCTSTGSVLMKKVNKISHLKTRVKEYE